MNLESNSLPQQRLSFKAKNKAWRKKHLDWASQKTYFNYSPVRNSNIHMRINYDLLNGKLHMDDLEMVLNPEHVKEKFTPDNIPHYPIMNSKLNVLKGEEAARQFDFRVVITNPLAISERENTKKNAIYQALQQLVSNQAQNEEEYQKGLEEMSDYFSYEWQDMREIRANQLLQHYMKEYNMKLLFNRGFEDAMCIGEEIYQCDIRGGEPVIERLDPLRVRIFRSGYSNKIEDADVIIIEDYWSPGKVKDAYYDVLTKKDIEYLDTAPDQLGTASINNVGERDERIGFINSHMIDDVVTTNDTFYFDPFNEFGVTSNSLAPFDTAGNVRVIRMYWKSDRKIKKIKSYNQETGEEEYNFYPENYVPDTTKGEEETIYYINEAWEGTKIGEEIYVNMRPRIVQYNRLSNPSRCHFGIVGSIYNLNNSKPYSLVDMMKPFAYLYDVIHDRLNKVMARNWGKIITLDMAKVPAGWDIDKWLYFAKHNNLAVVDSFKEGNIGAATGKLAGAMNNASSGVIDAELGNIVQQYINTLEFIKMEMSEVSGITRQREGQISNRETVGGVERATLQSSHITEWLFFQHDDVKKRALECFLETAKIALKGRKEKFQYLLSDGSLKVLDIDGDEFAEADYGLIVESSNNIQDLNQKIETMAQAALQNQMISFSTIFKLYTTASLTEKQRMVEKDEKAMQERQAQAQQEQLQAQQQQAQLQAQIQQQQLQLQEEANVRDNETKILVATISANARQDDGIEEPIYSQEAKDKLAENMRQFDEKMKLERDKLALDKDKARMDHDIKEKQLRKRTTSNNN